MGEAPSLAGGPGAPAPAPAVPALALAPLPAELGAEQAQAELAALKASPAFMRSWTDGEPNAVARMTRLYAAGYDAAPAAAVDQRDPAPERATGYALPLAPAGVALDYQAAQPLLEVAHAEGIGRGAFDVLAQRTLALAGGEQPMTDVEAGERLVRWHGEARAREILAAAQAVTRRAMERDPRAREVLTAIGTDAYVINALGEFELRRAGR